MIKEILVTREGLRKMEEELDNLKLVKRKEVAEKIKVARSYGDLSENSEYDEAKNEQAIVEAKILELETKLKHVKVIDEKDITTDTVTVGTKVVVYEFDFEEENEYQIVGSAESDPVNFKISDSSPLGAALLGKKVGDVVTYTEDELKCEIKAISK